MKPSISKHFKKNDPILFTVMNKIEPIELRQSQDYFVDLCDTIICQQLSDKAGATIFKRFKILFPNQKATPEFLLSLPDDQIRSTGPSRNKVSYLKNLSQAFIEGKLSVNTFSKLTDEEIIIALTKIKGIGKWTAEMFLIGSLGRPDVFSYGDLGLRRAIQKLYKFEQQPTQKEAEDISQKWSPYRSYACRILWRSNDL